MKSKIKNRKLLISAGLIGIVALSTVVVSLLCNSYHMTILNGSLFYFITISGITLMLGYGGFLGFSSITFMGLGGYICAYLVTKHAVPTLLAVLIAMIGTAIVVYLFGISLLKLRGSFFMFGTMGLLYIGTAVYANWMEFTGGPNGIYGIPTLNIFGFEFDTFFKWFALLLSLALAVIVIMIRIKKTSFGRNLMAVRDDETAAYTLGVNVFAMKVAAFTIGGAFAGLSGALYALHNGVISSSLFTFNVQLTFVIMVMLGGVQSPIGTLAGALLVNALPEAIRFVDKYINIIYGAMVILLMIFMPTGLAGIISSAVRKHRMKKAKSETKGGSADAGTES